MVKIMPGILYQYFAIIPTVILFSNKGLWTENVHNNYGSLPLEKDSSFIVLNLAYLVSLGRHNLIAYIWCLSFTMCIFQSWYTHLFP